MNWTIEVNNACHFVRVTAQGDFTVIECVGIKEDVISLDCWHPEMNVLIDYREVSFNNLNINALRTIGTFHQSKNEQFGTGKMALLMKSPRDFGFARQYEMITEDKVSSQVHVFLDENRALAWLDASSVAV